ncbi:MAG: ABC transporter ATP-binding protein [Clostridia bacterium]|nr:ABC transporter ATP-binding protein [Clostridia bacterium]
MKKQAEQKPNTRGSQKDASLAQENTDNSVPRRETPKKKKAGFWKSLLPYIVPYKNKLIIAVIFSLLTGIFVAVQPLVVKYIIDTGVSGDEISFFGKVFYAGPQSQKEQITFVVIACCVYIFVCLMRLSFWSVGYVNAQKALAGTLFTLRSKFFGHVQHMCMRFHDKNSSGELYNYIMGSPMTNIKTFLSTLVQIVPFQVVAMVISLVALSSYSIKLTGLILIISVIMALFYRFSRQKMRTASKDYLNSENRASQYIADVLHGSEAVKMYAIEEDTIKHFDEYVDDLKKQGFSYSMRTYIEAIKPEYTHYFGIGVVYLVGSILCIRGEISVGIFYAFLSSMTTILNTLSSWLNLAMTQPMAAEALERVNQIIDEHSTTPEVREEARRSIAIEKSSAIEHGKPCIAFDNVTFAYDEKPVFRNFSCQIGYHESIGLVGSSGSGKSTFTKLIMRLYDVQEGNISLHGRSVKDYATHELRASFGVVPQNPFIFAGTLWDNIRIAAPEATNYEIIQAMEVARVHEFVNELPMGWATVIGDGALTLSGGQKQRIAIARAVLKKPDIFIFDEATSALDNVSERLIQLAMEDLMQTHTVIFVAHRLSTIRNVNRILVFDHGNVIQEGSYDELASKPGEFRRLLDAAEAKDEMKRIDRRSIEERLGRKKQG